MKYRTTLFTDKVGLEVPADILEALGQGKRPPVKITINGFTFRNTVAIMGGMACVAINAENRKGCGVSGGETVEVTIELDTEPRIVAVPADLAKALKANSVAQKAFDKLSPSKRKAIIVSIEGAKAAETRQRRLDKAITDLSNAA